MQTLLPWTTKSLSIRVRCAISARRLEVPVCCLRLGWWKTVSGNEFHHLSSPQFAVALKSGSPLLSGLHTWPCAMSQNAWSREDTSATLDSGWSAGSRAVMVYVQARARFIQTDTLPSVTTLVAGTSCYFTQGCLAKATYNLSTTHKHVVRGPRTAQRMQRW